MRNDSCESLSPSLEQASQRKKKRVNVRVETGVPQEANARQGQMQGGDKGEIGRKRGGAETKWENKDEVKTRKRGGNENEVRDEDEVQTKTEVG